MDEKLWEEILRVYGNQCQSYKEQLVKRIPAMLAATIFAGTLGDTPLNKLNRALDEVTKEKENG
uniref:Uncharacterized protein n=1 Tax=viral metagenome TaxID=1070528 RepID=A0A6M3MBL1_9ZZZZ